ncbi:TIGR02300 family protein [Methylocystis sp.]|uniref:TIGR02300 family protein n=1 Tax=Methylocystis sp. TaxID=1911079 RepID=UPI0025EA12AA|nr:TIGR02300 family protein [Methylocystis sp.]
MAKAELGAKRRCLQCETLFFDLNRAPPACPKCQAVFVVIELPRSPPRAARGWNAFKRPAPVAANVADLSHPVREEPKDDVVPTNEEENDGVVPADEGENDGILPANEDEITELA